MTATMVGLPTPRCASLHPTSASIPLATDPLAPRATDPASDRPDQSPWSPVLRSKVGSPPTAKVASRRVASWSATLTETTAAAAAATVIRSGVGDDSLVAISVLRFFSSDRAQRFSPPRTSERTDPEGSPRGGRRSQRVARNRRSESGHSTGPCGRTSLDHFPAHRSFEAFESMGNDRRSTLGQELVEVLQRRLRFRPQGIAPVSPGRRRTPALQETQRGVRTE